MNAEAISPPISKSQDFVAFMPRFDQYIRIPVRSDGLAGDKILSSADAHDAGVLFGAPSRTRSSAAEQKVLKSSWTEFDGLASRAKRVYSSEWNLIATHVEDEREGFNSTSGPRGERLATSQHAQPGSRPRALLCRSASPGSKRSKPSTSPFMPSAPTV